MVQYCVDSSVLTDLLGSDDVFGLVCYWAGRIAGLGSGILFAGLFACLS